MSYYVSGSTSAKQKRSSTLTATVAEVAAEVTSWRGRWMASGVL